jgi:histidinol phosphatase-like PHP family hydrolase
VALEVNGLASRLDLSAGHVREALAAGVRITCGSDAHSAAGLASMTYAVHTARRGGAPAAAVLNTLPLEVLLMTGQRKD